jgi:hypothetical protein
MVSIDALLTSFSQMSADTTRTRFVRPLYEMRKLCGDILLFAIVLSRYHAVASHTVCVYSANCY